MENKNIILIAIAILVVALVAVGIYSLTNGGNNPVAADNNTTSFIDADTITQNNTSSDNATTNNTTTVGDNSTFTPQGNLTNNNTPFKVYDPQSDSYVPVIGEAFDEEVNRWYTYDEDGVRYYNTRINNQM